MLKVSDGDTVQVMHNGKAEKIRLAGIDAPEKDQPFGKAAKRYVLDLAAHKTVTVDVHTVDRYGRTVGEILFLSGESLNRILVSEGYAWHYKQYSDDPVLAGLEVEARSYKRGLWQDKNPIPPWEWRKAKRSKSSASKRAVVGEYHGNVKSGVFHRPGCKHYNCKNCTKGFASKNAAVSSGYRACGICKP